MTKSSLAHLAIPGARIEARVTPRASREKIEEVGDGTLRITVTAVAEGGKANAAVIRLLAKALGVAKSRLTLVRGDTARNKVFQLD